MSVGRGPQVALGPQVELDPVKAGEAGVGGPQRMAGREAVDLAAERTEGAVGSVVLADLEPREVCGQPGRARLCEIARADRRGQRRDLDRSVDSLVAT